MLNCRKILSMKNKLKIGLATGLAAIVFGCGNPINLNVDKVDKFDKYSKISFISDKKGNYDIYTMDTNGQNLEQVTDTSWNEYSHSWSSDGKQIVYQSDEGSDPITNVYYSNIYIINSNGTNKINLTNSEAGIYNGMPDYSPKGDKIVFISNREDRSDYNLYLVNADGNNLRKLTDSGVDYNHWQPDWNSDGTDIVYNETEASTSKASLYIININNGFNRKIETGSLYNQTPNFCPDSNYIGFSSNIGNIIEVYNLGVINLNTSNINKLTDNGVSWNPSWSPDGKEIVYQFFNIGTVKNGIRKINVNTKEEIILIENNDYNNTAPSWSPYLK